MATNAVTQTVNNNVNPYLQPTNNKHKIIQRPKNLVQQAVNAAADGKNNTVANTTQQNETASVAKTNPNSNDNTNNTTVRNQNTQNTTLEKRIDIYA